MLFVRYCKKRIEQRTVLCSCKEQYSEDGSSTNPDFDNSVKVTEWLPIGKIAAQMFTWYKYLIVSLVFSHLGFWSGSLFLIAPFPDLCLLVLFYICLYVFA